MEKSRFIESYVAAFLGALAAQKYNDGADPDGRWVKIQPVNDAETLAEYAWDSMQKSVTPSTDGMILSAATATTETVSTPTT